LKIQTDDTERKLNKLSGTVGNLNKLFGLFKVSAFVAGLKSIGDTLGKMTEKQMKYIQTQNIFNKTMGDFAGEATKFRNKMESMLGMDPQAIMDSMSTFQRLSETFGLTSERANLISTNLTQLASDMTAYGYSFENAMQKLKSGISRRNRANESYGCCT
jgi:hypothetical protein